eukprot:1681172-Pyramimonas_sp.AAC.1
MTPKRLRTGGRRFSASQNAVSFYCDDCQRGPSANIEGTWGDNGMRQRLATARIARWREGLNCRWLCTGCW